MGPYQEQMRQGLNGELCNHYAARLSATNLARLAHIKPGQDWRDLPRDLLPPGMQRALRKDHTRRYRRMTSEGVPRAVITRFRDRSRESTPILSRIGRSLSGRRPDFRAFPIASYFTVTDRASMTKSARLSRHSSQRQSQPRLPAALVVSSASDYGHRSAAVRLHFLVQVRVWK